MHCACAAGSASFAATLEPLLPSLGVNSALVQPLPSHASSLVRRLFPFVEWWQPPNRAHWRADAIAGISVALVLVPQSMAYAQLAGLPAAYGLYTAFLPVMIAAMWGSSGQLATGPVAVVSLLTGTTLATLALPGSAQYVAYAVALAFLVGALQLALGAFRLGALVNLLSHPVISGFTSAAAIIIALSQLNKLLGVPIGRSGFFFFDVYGVLQQVAQAHRPTLAFGLGALIALLFIRRKAPRLPGVLIVSVTAIALSASLDFSRQQRIALERLEEPFALEAIRAVLEERAEADRLHAERTALAADRSRNANNPAGSRAAQAEIDYRIELLNARIESLEQESARRLQLLKRLEFARTPGPDQGDTFLPRGAKHDDEPAWRIAAVDAKGVEFVSGGLVVGEIPPGLPRLRLPQLDMEAFATLLSSALVIALVGFMEAISIAKAISTRTRRRLDPNQELVGQGLANLVGSLSQAYPASGSFSRTAVNFAAGARSGVSSVVAALVVLTTLLFLTPLLYHLPQAVLAAVIMMAVFSLINLRAIAHAWSANRHDGVAGAATFVATLLFAPHLDLGILVGVGLSVVLFLFRTMRPRVSILGRHPGGALRDAEAHDLPLSRHIVALRFDGQLYFGNVSYFEDTVLSIPVRFPKVQAILVVGDGIHQIDASGDEVVRHLAERLREGGVTLAFSGLEPQIVRVLRATGTLSAIGKENLFLDENEALAELAKRVTDPEFDRAGFPLRARDEGPG